MITVTTLSLLKQSTNQENISGTPEQSPSCQVRGVQDRGCSRHAPCSSCPASPWREPDPGRSSALPLGSSPDSNVHNPRSGTPLILPQYHAVPVGHTALYNVHANGQTQLQNCLHGIYGKNKLFKVKCAWGSLVEKDH